MNPPNPLRYATGCIVFSNRSIKVIRSSVVSRTKGTSQTQARHAHISEELRLYIMVAVCVRLQIIVVMSTDVTEGVAVT